ncbi:hypothetical protein R1sor_007796 [Riccia sorocarpa]|uniref:Uncharacterized protein n=1 Tax=Riccia sorocarpa TaxID=122646 RepID=A0ABD3HVM9_9MARC
METGSVEVTPRGAGTRGLRLKKIYVAIPLIPIVLLSIIVIGLTGSAYQRYFDPDEVLKASDASIVLLSYTPQVATLAIVAAFAGLWYSLGKSESGVSAASASALALVSWANAIVAFGFACKQTNFGLPGVGLAGELKGLAGLTILLFFFETALKSSKIPEPARLMITSGEADDTY